MKILDRLEEISINLRELVGNRKTTVKMTITKTEFQSILEDSNLTKEAEDIDYCMMEVSVNGIVFELTELPFNPQLN